VPKKDSIEDGLKLYMAISKIAQSSPKFGTDCKNDKTFIYLYVSSYSIGDPTKGQRANNI
jgi:hypothetical protein